jgi:hypothetical protein
MKLTPIVAACAVFTSFCRMAATDLTVVNFGGANGNAQKKAYFEPFEKASGNKVVGVEYNGEQAKIKAMVEAKNVTWDVVEVESPDVARGCDEGLFEKLDYSKIGNKADFSARCRPRMRHRHLRLVHRDGLQRRQAQNRPHHLGRFLGREEVPWQARHCARVPATTLNLR